MRIFLKYLILFFTLFNTLMFSSCSSKYVELDVPVEKYVVINDGGSFGTTVIQFYVSDSFEHDLDLLKDIKIKFSYRPENSLVNKTVTENGKVDSFIGADDSYFYVNIDNRVATNIEDPIEIKSVIAKIEKRFVENEDDNKPGEKDQLFGILEAFIYGLIVAVIGFVLVYVGGPSLDNNTGRIMYGLGYLIPIGVSIISFIYAGIGQGIIVCIFSVISIISSIIYTSKL